MSRLIFGFLILFKRCLTVRRTPFFIARHAFHSAPQHCYTLGANAQELKVPLAQFRGEVRVIDSTNFETDTTPQLGDILKTDIVGFDLEYQPNFYAALNTQNADLKRPSVIQVCGDATCLIYLIYKIGHIPTNLLSLLTNENVIKVSHGAAGDMRLLHAHYGVKSSGFVDLQGICKDNSILPCNLKSVCKHVLQLELDKKEQCSNWVAQELTRQQIDYAATDAWVTREIFVSLAPKKITRLYMDVNGDVASTEQVDNPLISL